MKMIRVIKSENIEMNYNSEQHKSYYIEYGSQNINNEIDQCKRIILNDYINHIQNETNLYYDIFIKNKSNKGNTLSTPIMSILLYCDDIARFKTRCSYQDTFLGFTIYYKNFKDTLTNDEHEAIDKIQKYLSKLPSQVKRAIYYINTKI